MSKVNQQIIDDQNMVERYLADQLSEAERECFEAYFLEHPETIRQLDNAAKLKAGLSYLHAAGTLDTLIAARQPATAKRWLAAAASLVLVLVGSFLWRATLFHSDRLIAKSTTEFSSRWKLAPPLAGSYNLEPTRASDYDLTVPLPPKASLIELRLKPNNPSVQDRYRILVERIGANGQKQSLTSEQGFALANDGRVPIYLSTEHFPPGMYEISVESTTDPSSSNLYWIEFISQKTRQ